MDDTAIIFGCVCLCFGEYTVSGFPLVIYRLDKRVLIPQFLCVCLTVSRCHLGQCANTLEVCRKCGILAIWGIK